MWCKSIEEEVKAAGVKWNELGQTYQNQIGWRRIVMALLAKGIKGHKPFESLAATLEVFRI